MLISTYPQCWVNSGGSGEFSALLGSLSMILLRTRANIFEIVLFFLYIGLLRNSYLVQLCVSLDV